MRGSDQDALKLWRLEREVRCDGGGFQENTPCSETVEPSHQGSRVNVRVNLEYTEALVIYDSQALVSDTKGLLCRRSCASSPKLFDIG